MSIVPLLTFLSSSSVPAQSGARLLTVGDGSNRAPAFSPDARYLAFESDRHGSWDVLRLDTVTGDVDELVVGPADERSPAWSPDGRFVVFVRTSELGNSLGIVEIETGTQTTVLQTDSEDDRVLFPDWAPDARTVAYTSAGDGRFAIEWLEIDVGAVREAGAPDSLDIDALAGGRWPRWSPSGDRVVYFSRVDTDGRDDEIYLLNVDSGARTRLTSRAGHDFCPAWSPSGTHLVFVSVETDSSRSLRIVDTSGIEIARLASDWHRVTEPTWSRDGAIAYAAKVSSSPDEPYQIYVETAPALP